MLNGLIAKTGGANPSAAAVLTVFDLLTTEQRKVLLSNTVQMLTSILTEAQLNVLSTTSPTVYPSQQIVSSLEFSIMAVAVPTSEFSTLTSSDISNLISDHFIAILNLLTIEQAQELLSSQIFSIIEALTVEQLGSLSSDLVKTLISRLTPKQISSIPFNTLILMVQRLTPQQISSFTASQLGAIREVLTRENVFSLSLAQRAALGYGDTRSNGSIRIMVLILLILLAMVTTFWLI